VILLLNGAFGIGKTSVARALVHRIPDSMLYDAEIIGIGLQRLARLGGRGVDDFQDMSAWRKLTIRALRVARFGSRNLIVPMAISNTSYLAELRMGLTRFERQVVHYCLVAPEEVVHARLKNRGSDPVRDRWQFRRASECCILHTRDEFAEHVIAANRSVEEIARELAARLGESRS
jgi:chloramphenicol 3-O-phosphotransferase